MTSVLAEDQESNPSPVVRSGVGARWNSVVPQPGLPQRPIRINARLMDYDKDKVDEMVLALLFLPLHDGGRAWKGHDWDALGRLHEKA